MSSGGYTRAAVAALYASTEWKARRYEAFMRGGGRCALCGRGRIDGVVMHVDHIVPLSVNWSRRLDPSNLQILCEDCNEGKSNRDSTDWRYGGKAR